MPRKAKSPAAHPGTPHEPAVDLKTARRVLAWLNGAHRPEDLLRPPGVRMHIHMEYRKRGFPERYPPVDEPHDHEARPARARDDDQPDPRVLAEVMRRRDANPVYGFLRLDEVMDLEPFRDWLDKWWWVFSRATRGEWTGPFDQPEGAFDRTVHAALLRTGKVLFFGLPTGKDSWLWTPGGAGAGTGQATTNKPDDSLFCSGHAFLSDGRLLVVGGGGDGTGARHNHGWIFDPSPGVESWTRTAGDGTPGNGDMAYRRWYPTLVNIGDEPGRVFVASGDEPGGVDVPQLEMYMEDTDRFERVWGPAGVDDTSVDHSFPQIYPALNLLPGGEVFYSPTGWYSGGSASADYPAAKPSGFFEFQSTTVPAKATWTDVGTQDDAAEDALARVKGMAVLLVQPSCPFVQAMIVGGGKDPESTTTYQMINLSALTPRWGPPLPLPDGLARVNVNLVALPDGTVFVSGGRRRGGTPRNAGACWIYDPAAMTWQECDALSNMRTYHSVALLLPDGRVVTSGSEEEDEQATYEVFSPPYLFAGDGRPAARPSITSLPAQVHLGQDFPIQTPSPSSIAKVTLVRPMAVTHQTDSEQRVIQLPFRVKGPAKLIATAPDGWRPHGLAPRGWYMVFLVDDRGVPSVGRFMHLH
jgi:hypothetical protein